MTSIENVLVTGGAGYVGAVLVPRLLSAGYHVRVVDLYLFGEHVLDDYRDHPHLEQIRGDIRDQRLMRDALAGVDAVIHLACISNDPSVELDPALSRSINYDSFRPLVRAGVASGVQRFIFASSASIYGISDRLEVTEEHPLVPVSEYNKLKAACEPVLFEHQSPDFTTVSIRPATLYGYSPRQRLDLTVNVLTAHAIERGRITVFGGAQRRPCLHIEDMVDLYCLLLEAPAVQIGGQIFNVGHENLTVSEIACTVRCVVEQELPKREPIEIETVPSDDPRSYHICSDKLNRELGFTARRGIEEGVRDLLRAFRKGLIPNALTDDRYYNVRSLKRRQSTLHVV